MKLVNIFAAVGIVSLVAAGCSTTSSSGTGTGGATGTGGSVTGGTGGTGTGGTGTGGTSTGGTGTGGTSTGGSGTGGSGTGGAGGGSPGCTSTIVGATCQQLSTKNQACDTCMQGNCCNEMNTCFGDAQCADLYNCIVTSCAGITDQTQFDTCVSTKCTSCATQTAQTELNAFATCQKNSCGTQCGGSATDGGI